VDKHDIAFYYEVEFELKDEALQKEKIMALLRAEKQIGGQIQFVFMSDEQLYEMNMEYLSHDTYTDILTFDMSEGEEIAGDMYISIDRVKDNAKSLGVDWEEELDRVMVHGLLHLMGYNDKTEEEQKEMRKREDVHLAYFASIT
jgi:rRNA maturation RNase YbeY